MTETTPLPEHIIDCSLLNSLPLRGDGLIRVTIEVQPNTDEVWIIHNTSRQLQQEIESLLQTGKVQKREVLDAISCLAGPRIRGVILSRPTIDTVVNEDTIKPIIEDHDILRSIRDDVADHARLYLSGILDLINENDPEKTVPPIEVLVEKIAVIKNIDTIKKAYVHLILYLVLCGVIDKINTILDDVDKLCRYNFRYNFKEYATMANLYNNQYILSLAPVLQTNILQEVQYEVEVALEKMQLISRFLNHKR